MNNPQDIHIEDFSYPLTEEKIAKFALEKRDEAKLLYWHNGKAEDYVFRQLPQLLSKDTLLICNDTKVVYARLFFYKTTGSKIEIFCLEPEEPNDMQLAFAQRQSVVFKCLVGNNKKWKSGPLQRTEKINGEDVTLSAERLESENECWKVRFSWDRDVSFAELMLVFGVIPLPPYLNREAESEDRKDYQTIYANYEGSVAAPTAGLHFTEKTFSDLKDKGIETCFVTLHVGAGTFKPVTSETIGEHIMHTEKITVNRSVIEKLYEYADRKTFCVGTTSVRTIESLYWYGVHLLENSLEYSEIDVQQWEPYAEHKDYSAKEILKAILQVMDRENLSHVFGQTQLLIAPGYTYRLVKGMVTNFHQPKSTLLLLVSAMIGDSWKEVYRHALDNGYRFLSYGDACLFEKQDKKNNIQ